MVKSIASIHCGITWAMPGTRSFFQQLPWTLSHVFFKFSRSFQAIFAFKTCLHK